MDRINVAYDAGYTKCPCKTDTAVKRVLDVAKDDRLTLLYAASDRERNNAVVLREHLESHVD